MPAPSPFSPEAVETLAPFRVDAPLEVRECLRALRDRCAPLALHGLLRDADLTHARLVSVNAPIDHVELDIAVQEARGAAVMSAGTVQAVGFLDRVKVQFELTRLTPVEAAEGLRVRALLPLHLYRRQRRDTYRVRLPASSVARCTVPAGSGGCGAAIFEVLDASIGGVSLRWNAQRPPSCGSRIEDCVLTLPDMPPFRCDLLVRSVEPIALSTPGSWRVGCAFETLSGPLQRTMQRFVFEADRRSLQQRQATAPAATASRSRPPK